MSLERAREREVHKYYQTWLESSEGFSTTDHKDALPRFHLDGSSLRASNDKSLIAFAQLGCLRLNAKRGIVALLDTSRQYVLAEATKSLSLVSSLTDGSDEEELWFGNASFPRSQGMSEHALNPPEYTAIGHNGITHTARALVINDITKDDRFSSSAFAGRGVTFYCGVPIISNAGHAIGVYNVTDDKPREGLTPAELIHLQDISHIVMTHLETVKNNVARFRGENMVVGLSNFMRGSSSIQLPTQELSRTTGPDLGMSHKSPTTQQFKGLTITNADPDILKATHSSLSAKISREKGSGGDQYETGERPVIKSSVPAHVSESFTGKSSASAPNLRPDSQQGGPQPSRSHAPEPEDASQSTRSTRLKDVFSRAAFTIRDCTVADGVVFFDAASISLSTRSHTMSHVDEQNEFTRSCSIRDDSASDAHEYSSSGLSTDSDDLGSDSTRLLRSRGRRCKLLGYALDVSYTSTANTDTITNLGLTEQSLRRFIRRYPHGKSFSFNASGKMSTSDTDTPDHSNSQKSSSKISDKSDATKTSKFRIWTTEGIAEELIRFVPGARNIVWLPLRDFHRHRWSAGMFLWSRRPDRLLTAQDDMAYLRTFASSIMTEVSRVDAELADQAKSNFIANISHELRSPLHGIIGSVEFLQETALDHFQSSMTSDIETCAKTLLDTVEHVLDFAKINQVSTKYGTHLKPTETPSDKSPPSLEIDLDLAELVEEAVEAVFAGSTFQKFRKDKHSLHSAEMQVASQNDSQVLQDNMQQKSDKFSSKTYMITQIERNASWWVRVAPGAIRRVIMNVLGNALKYTDRGYILVALSTDRRESGDQSSRRVKICVRDTGRGMSDDFLRNHAFTPFTQESQFSEGIGLGLSIVRQISHALGGHVTLESTEGVGTEVQISVALPIVPIPTVLRSSESMLAMVTNHTIGMTLCALEPPVANKSLTTIDATREVVRSSLFQTFETWFGMKTLTAPSMDGVEANIFLYAEPPSIEYLLRHHGHSLRGVERPIIIATSNAFESALLVSNGIEHLTSLGRIVEVISQPCGPQKLIKVIHRCLTRLGMLVNDLEEEPNTGSADIEIAHNAVDSGELRNHGSSTSSTYTAVPQSASGSRTLVIERSPQLVPVHSEQVEPRTDVQEIPRHTADQQSETQSALDMGPEGFPRDHNDPESLVLLVDDNEINLKLLVALMKKAQRAYMTAENGLEAVQLYEKISADPKRAFKHILMDINMPVMDGTEATRLIRRFEKKSDPQHRATVIALTGFSVESTREEMMNAGADHFLSKPVKFKDLLNLLTSS